MMPTYDFTCDCGVTEIVTSMKDRDARRYCPKGHVLKRQLAPPLTVLWAGRFHSPWAKKQKDELGDYTW